MHVKKNGTGPAEGRGCRKWVLLRLHKKKQAGGSSVQMVVPEEAAVTNETPAVSKSDTNVLEMPCVYGACRAGAAHATHRDGGPALDHE